MTPEVGGLEGGERHREQLRKRRTRADVLNGGHAQPDTWSCEPGRNSRHEGRDRPTSAWTSDRFKWLSCLDVCTAWSRSCMHSRAGRRYRRLTTGDRRGRMRRVGGLVLVCFSMMATAAWAAPALVRQWSSTRKVVPTDASRAPRAARSVQSAQAPVLLGETAVQSAGTGGPAGRAEAFRFKDRRPGVARSVRLYVASANSATGLTAGLYSDRSGAPGRLLSTGSVVGSRRRGPRGCRQRGERR